jgi:hypothetical protein
MKKICLLFLFLLLNYSTNLYSQSFISEIEKEAIQEYETDSLNYDFLKSICVIDSTLTIERLNSYKLKLNTLIKSFPEKEIKDSREKKRIKKIYC